MTLERTFLMIKPDGVKRALIGEIIHRFEQKGFKLVAAKLMDVPEALAEEHYAEHREKPFFEGLVQFITSGPVFATVWEGEQIIQVSRSMIGKTNPLEAAPGTIRGDYGYKLRHNLIHGSDSASSAEREIALFFDEGDFT